MKIRMDYVTNSSSSSYIIARHKDYEMSELKEFIAANKSLIDGMIERNRKYGCQEIDESELIDNIEYEFLKSPTMTIDNWDLIIGEADNDGGISDEFMYDCKCIDTEHFKMKREYC